MKILKAWYHFKAAVKKVMFKIVFGKRIKIGRGTTWREDFIFLLKAERLKLEATAFLTIIVLLIPWRK